MKENIILGIDLGTTYTCVAVHYKNNIEIIENDVGDKVTPSCVTFSNTNNKIIVGKHSHDKTNTRNVIMNVKRLIGRKYDDEVVQAEISNQEYFIFEEDGYPMVEIDWQGEKVRQSPHMISSHILKEMKRLVESKYKTEVSECVISVPARFHQSQKEATETAAKIAGLSVLQIVNEPTAAAWAYGTKFLPEKNDQNILLVLSVMCCTFSPSNTE